MNYNKNNINIPLSTNDYSMTRGDNGQIEKPSLLCLNDNVLLHVFSYLDLTNSINLADTCVRLHNLSCWKFKKYTELDTEKYLIEGSLPLQKILYSIGPHIQALKARLCQINTYDMRECGNVQSLQILGILNDYVATSRINAWINKLNLETLWFMDYSSSTKIFYKMFNGITNLKELRIDDHTLDCGEFVSKNVNIERLSLRIHKNLNGTFNFEIFSNLRHLTSLHLRLPHTKHLKSMTQFGNFDGLTEFSFECYEHWDVSPFNTFLKCLAENTKLDKLRVYTGKFYEETFTPLKAMNLSAFSLCCDYNTDDFINFVLEYSAPQLKHVQLWGCSIEEFEIVVENWKNLETFCVYLEYDYEKCLDDAFLEEVLKLSTDRPMLRLHIDSYKVHDPQLPCHIEVSFD